LHVSLSLPLFRILHLFHPLPLTLCFLQLEIFDSVLHPYVDFLHKLQIRDGGMYNQISRVLSFQHSPKSPAVQNRKGENGKKKKKKKKKEKGRIEGKKGKN